MEGSTATETCQATPARANHRHCPGALPRRQRGHIAKYARAVMLALAPWLCCLPTSAFAKTTPNAVMQIAPAAPSAFGTRLTFYAILSSPTQGGPVPTGTINFAYRDASNTNYDLCSPLTIDTNYTVQSCQAQIGAYPPAGADRIILIYSGDANYDGDATGALAQEDYVVTYQTPTIALDPPAPVYVGQYAALHLVIGNATQTQGHFGASIGGDNGTCNITVPGAICSAGKTRFAGTFEVDAGFDGDANHGVVASAPVGQITILPAPTTLTIIPPNPIALGDSVFIGMNIASIVDPAATFLGDIVLSDGEVSCHVHLASPGSSGACTLTPVSAGVRHLTATYSGYSDAAGSTATADLTVVAPASYTITTAVNPVGAGTVTCTPNPVASGGNSTCIAMANSGYAFDAFTGDCSGAACALTNVTADKSIVANFTTAQRPGTISVRGIANGDTTPSTVDGTDFGSTPVGTSVTHAFTIDNLGAREASVPPGAQRSANGQAMPGADGDLVVSSIASSNPAFTVSGGLGTIAVNASAMFNVRFNAGATGTQTATITIASNDAHTPTYTFVVSAVAAAAMPSSVQAAPTASNWMLGVLAGLLSMIGLASVSGRKRAGPMSWR